MDKPTVIESVRYRCWGRGEDYEEFVSSYCSLEELKTASQSEGLEGEFAKALLAYRAALTSVESVAERIPED